VKRTVLVAGATGYLGRYVVAEAVRAGWHVRAIVREPARANLDERAEVVTAQVTDPATLGGVADDVDVVFSSVGITRQNDGLTYDDVDFGANLHLLDRAVQAGCTRFVYVSVLNPQHALHTDLVAAKERFVDRLRASPIESVVIRPTGFFSDMREFLQMAAAGRAWVIGDGTARLNPIHGEDLARVCVDALDGPTGDVPVGGPDVLTQLDIAALAFAAVGRRPRITRVPLWLVDAALWLVGRVHRRWWNIGSFMASAGRHDMVAPPTGRHHLGEWYRSQWAAGGG